MSCIGTNIKFLRKRRKISQGELAENVGLKRGNIASYENGTAEPKSEAILNIADFFGVTVKNLMCKEICENHMSMLKVESLIVPIEKITHFEAQIDEFKMMFNGFKCYHSRKAKEVKIEALPDDLKSVLRNVKNLFEVSEELLKSHEALIHLIKSNIDIDESCNEC